MIRSEQMSALRKIFGPSRKEVWKQLSDQLGAQYVEGGFARPDKVQVRVKDWTVTLDTYVVSTGKATIVFTRMRAPYESVIPTSPFDITIRIASYTTAGPGGPNPRQCPEAFQQLSWV